MTRSTGSPRDAPIDGPDGSTDPSGVEGREVLAGREAVVFEDGGLPPGTPTTLDGLPRERRRLVLRCTSGQRFEGEWVGVPVTALVGAADAPDATTHLLVESTDGCVACVSIAEARDAILALDGDRFDGETATEATPRLVGPNVEGPRAVKEVTRIVATSLRPGEDPAEYERDPR